MDFYKEKLAAIIDKHFTVKDEVGFDRLNEAIDEMKQAFGYCERCFGKGYSTEYKMSSIQAVDYGVTGGATYKEGKGIELTYCDCPRGQQLKFLLNI